MRLDVWLLESKLASSRSHAQELIDSGQVFLKTISGLKELRKASFKVSDEMKIVVEDGPANRFVSRGGLKLEGALNRTGIDVDGLLCLDVGISTGGFTDCLLKQNAGKVIGVDVGHNQVHSSLINHPRLQFVEGVNARALESNEEFQKLIPVGGFDLIVMDVSFISISLIVSQFPRLLKTGGIVLSLVKPQFEVGVQGLGKGGIVKDTSLYKDIEKKIKSELEDLGLVVEDYFESPITGKDGNNEFFVFAKKV